MIPGRIPGRERWEVEDKLYLSDAVGRSGELKIYGGTSGEKTLEIFYGSTSVLSIIATGATCQILGGATHALQIGDAGTTSHSLNKNDDLYISGKLEVDGEIYFDSKLFLESGARVADNYTFGFGDGNESIMMWGLAQETAETFIWGLADASKSVIICDKADRLKDFDHAAQSNPTIFMHSATDPDSANDEWMSLSHDVTDGVIAVGSGTLNLGGTTINLVNATRTASTVTHDSYVVIEIGGTEYKFMLGS